MTITAQYTNTERTFVNVTLEPGDSLASEHVQAAFTAESHVNDAGVWVNEPKSYPAGDPTTLGVPCNADNPVWVALLALVEAGTVEIAAYVPPDAGVPDNPSLGDWRVGLVLWVRAGTDGAPSTRLAEVSARVQALITAGNPLGQVARERLEYSNNVKRVELLQLAPVFGFTPADVDESLHRARQVSLGDLSGVWPLPVTAAA